MAHAVGSRPASARLLQRKQCQLTGGAEVPHAVLVVYRERFRGELPQARSRRVGTPAAPRFGEFEKTAPAVGGFGKPAAAAVPQSQPVERFQTHISQVGSRGADVALLRVVDAARAFVHSTERERLGRVAACLDAIRRTSIRTCG